MIFLYAGAALVFCEIAVFAMVCDAVGFFTALFLCFAAGAIGIFLVQQQGLGLIARLQNSLDQGLLPMNEMFDAGCLFAAGMLLIMPGFISDCIGLALLLPFVRQQIRVVLARRYGSNDGSYNPDTGVIEGDFIRVREESIAPPDEAGR